MNLHGIVQFALSQTWAMEPAAHRRMMEILLRHADGVKLTEEDLVAATGRTMPGRSAEREIDEKTGIATIPIHGVIAHRASAVARVSSRVGTSVEHIREDLRVAMASDAVKGIVLDVDSPGGSVAGITELAEEIRAAREQKPIVAHTDSLMASAAYWLASQADKIFATRTAEVGSIGVIAAFYDDHRAAANAGFDPIVIKSTPAKGGVQGNGSVSDSERADIQRAVDHFHGLFIEAVGAGRRIDDAAAKALGDGRVYIGAEAQQRGFIDGIHSRASVVKQLRTLMRTRAAAAEEQPLPVGDVPAGANVDVPKEPNMIKPEEKGAAPAPTPVPTLTPAPAPVPAPDPAAQERARCVAIQNAAAGAQRELAAKLVADGTPLVEALTALNQDLGQRLAQAQSLPSAATQPLAKGNTADVTPGSKKDPIADMEEGEEKWKAQWKADKRLRAEFFDSEETYFASMRNADRARKVSHRSQLQDATATEI